MEWIASPAKNHGKIEIPKYTLKIHGKIEWIVKSLKKLTGRQKKDDGKIEIVEKKIRENRNGSQALLKNHGKIEIPK